MKFKFSLLVLLSTMRIVGQTYLYNSESKLNKQVATDRWVTKLTYSSFSFKWCDQYPKTDSCMNEQKEYSLRLDKDTIFIIGKTSNNKSVVHPQYSLRTNDSLLFLTETIDGFENGSTEGYIKLLKDTTICLAKKKWKCYVYRRISSNREFTEVEYIFLEKKMLIPIYNKLSYFSKNDKQEIFSAYKSRKLHKIKRN
jgi:hypothetical protein